MGKKYILLIDTETTGTLKYPIAYDVGFVVTDRTGHIYEKAHYLVREVFANLPMMATAYYADKFVGYLDRLNNQEIVATPFKDILAAIDNVIERYQISTLAAYNLQFDMRAMSNTCEWLYENRNWCKYSLDQLCIMCAACDVLYNRKYIRTCRDNNWVTEKGNVKCSAETGYRYISGDWNFEEEHRGLDDCEIEAQILAAIYKLHKKFDGTPKGFPFRQVYAREA